MVSSDTVRPSVIFNEEERTRRHKPAGRPGTRLDCTESTIILETLGAVDRREPSGRRRRAGPGSGSALSMDGRLRPLSPDRYDASHRSSRGSHTTSVVGRPPIERTSREEARTPERLLVRSTTGGYGAGGSRTRWMSSLRSRSRTILVGAGQPSANRFVPYSSWREASLTTALPTGYHRGGPPPSMIPKNGGRRIRARGAPRSLRRPRRSERDPLGGDADPRFRGPRYRRGAPSFEAAPTTRRGTPFSVGTLLAIYVVEFGIGLEWFVPLEPWSAVS